MPEEVQGKPEKVTFESEGYKMTPDDKMREELEAEVMGTTSYDTANGMDCCNKK